MYLTFFTQMVVLFLIMLLGAVAYKKNTLDDNSTKKLSSLIMNFTNPAMIISSVASTKRVGSFSDIGFIALLVISCYVASVILGLLMPRILKAPQDEKIIYNAMTVFSNFGFMGVPIIGAILGPQYILYGAVFVFFNNIMVYSYGIYIFTKASPNNEAFKVNFRSMFINPGMIASFAAMFVFILNLHLPPVLGKTATMVGDMTGPLSMMVIGVSLARARISDLIASARLWTFAFLRLFAIPLFLSLIYRPFIDAPEIFTILMIMLSMPVGSITIIYAYQYDVDSGLVSSGLLLTTILSVITVPAVIYFAGI
ncbi:MAG: AEC family transporter [Peptococcaceae bacterium]